MTVPEAQSNQENILNQEKVDANLVQQKPDTNLSQNVPPEVNNQNVSIQEEDNGDPNWKAFREARKRDRAEREAAERRAMEKEQEIAALKAAMEAAFIKPQTPQQPQQPYSYYGQDQYAREETEEEKIDKRVNSILAERERAAAAAAAEREMREYPQRLQNNYPDINHVASQENLDYLDYHYPEVSRLIQRMPEGYDRWVEIYHAVKKFVPNHSNARKDSMRAEANYNKPKSISSTGLTQNTEGSHPLRLTEERKAQNWERMQRTLKGIS